jgi:glutathione synthase/RimK-type ligase-like ATP-grasp enzyme
MAAQGGQFMQVSEILRNARIAKAQTGRSVVAQCIEMLRLRFGLSGMTPEFYFNYRLFEPAMPWRDKRTYIGPWRKKRIYRIQDPETTRIAADKLTAYRHFDAHGLAYPRLLATTNADAMLPDVAALMSAEAIDTWLRKAAPYPFFVKPSASTYGWGSMLVERRDGDDLVLGNGDRIAIAAFAIKHGAPAAPVQLIQELIRPHPALAAAIGNRAATARIVAISDGVEPEIYAAGLRIPSGRSMTDNFQAGKSGNLMAFIDCASGELTTVVGGLGIDWSEVDTHPDTGAMLKGFRIPDWDRAVALVKAGCHALPGMKIHGWDIAFSDKGPLIVEDNVRGDINLAQLAPGIGLANPRFLRLYPGGKL